MIWFMLAAFFPCILVVLFSVLTRSKWVGSILAFVIVGASIEKGFFHNEWIIFIDVVSLLAGYIIIDQLKLHKKEDD
ncbi:DUF2198 domain-containing protein [Staphylococcus casei]|uniref:DUF2198 domain-containing protein n=2 Tax=Staphylococcus TaxID=1279 RepID=A0A9Q6HNN1_9STAP|nr:MULTISPECIES: CsbA family protein [Staphylococcus]MBU0436961.1 CsbA family protein [Staphylococcus succinus]MDH9162140.1 CsbA family protein [Staphylococcus succinus]MEB7462071.1 CsbA family protein [Staphylococcus succinus]MEB8125225.1 CsbA family protein [Staphylococcus succinus]MEB8125963.1 CsbA family protein [Staphylococcus succinus]